MGYLVATFWSLAVLYIFCHFGQLMTDQFVKLDETICTCDWYLFPNDVKRILPIVLMASQQSVTLQGYGNIACIRENFRRVTLY